MWIGISLDLAVHCPVFQTGVIEDSIILVFRRSSWPCSHPQEVCHLDRAAAPHSSLSSQQTGVV